MSNTQIKQSEVQQGDTIKVSYTLGGVLIERTGVVALAAYDHLSTAQDVHLWSGYWDGDFTFQLIDRPKPPTLPTAPGTILIVDDNFGRGAQIILTKCERWVYLKGGAYDLNQLQAWKLAKVVEA